MPHQTLAIVNVFPLKGLDKTGTCAHARIFLTATQISSGSSVSRRQEAEFDAHRLLCTVYSVTCQLLPNNGWLFFEIKFSWCSDDPLVSDALSIFNRSGGCSSFRPYGRKKRKLLFLIHLSRHFIPMEFATAQARTDATMMKHSIDSLLLSNVIAINLITHVRTVYKPYVSRSSVTAGISGSILPLREAQPRHVSSVTWRR